VNRAQRRAAGKQVRLDEAITGFGDYVLRDTGKCPQVALGPIVWGIDPVSDTRHWYFVIGSIDTKGELRIDQFKIAADDRDLAERCRADLWLELIQRRPIVLHDFDDELALAQWSEAICPGERSTSIRGDQVGHA
jgi:hypothetical protein